ncbi:MAG: helix-turn-helix domain-containing protein [Desulfobacteraceae bacterium]|nr:MAG: helix-turn-helix domain-containing protein [Desulfobacteraceae bacterium]
MIEIRVGKLAKMLGIHRNTVRNWIKNGELDATPMVGKRYGIGRESFTRFLESKGVAKNMILELMADAAKTPGPGKTAKPETPIIQKEVRMLDKPVGSVMVVGGGIAGIQASLDLADSGYYVYLLEKGPGIGGGMARLDKTFPTNDCAM